MYFIYSILFTLTAILMLPFYAVKLLSQDGSMKNFNERFGAVKRLEKNGKGRIWIHASSVGEVGIAATLLKELKIVWPEKEFVISTMTPTGRAVAKKVLGSMVSNVFYVPFDWDFCVKRFLRRAKPDAVLVVETEIWPNLVHRCRLNNIPVYMVNGRISSKSFPRYSLFMGLLKIVFCDFHKFLMRSEDDAYRIKALTAPDDKVVVTGNMKFDVFVGTNSEGLAKLDLWKEKSLLIIAGSTLRGEEEILLTVLEKLEEEGKDVKLMIAPRHPERFDGVAELIEGRKIDFQRWSEVDEKAVRSAVMLLDTLGELAGLFKSCDIAFIGGSLVPKGGHNILEPAFFGKPVVVGSSMENFRDIFKVFINKNAVVQVGNEAELVQTFSSLLEDGEKRERLGKSALSILQDNKGAVGRTVKILKDVLK